MAGEFSPRKSFHGGDGVLVIVPNQESRDNLEVIFEDVEGYEEELSEYQEEGDFKKIRVPANIRVINQDRKTIDKFFPPIELRVAYRDDEISQRGENEWDGPKLAYWDPDREKYVILSNEEHEFLVLPPTIGQILEAKIWNWTGDPPIVVGR